MNNPFYYPVQCEYGDIIDRHGHLIGYVSNVHYSEHDAGNRIAECLNALEHIESPAKWITKATEAKAVMTELCGLLGVETPQQAYDKVKRMLHPEICEVNL